MFVQKFFEDEGWEDSQAGGLLVCVRDRGLEVNEEIRHFVWVAVGSGEWGEDGCGFVNGDAGLSKRGKGKGREQDCPRGKCADLGIL